MNGSSTTVIGLMPIDRTTRAVPASPPRQSRHVAATSTPSSASAVMMASLCTARMKFTSSSGLAVDSHRARVGSIPWRCASRGTVQASSITDSTHRMRNRKTDESGSAPVIPTIARSIMMNSGPYGGGDSLHS